MKRPSERVIVLLIAAIQFINILEFMIVMPLGPDFARSLAIPTNQLGLIAGSYTFAGAVSGIIGSFFLDRFDRRIALAFAMAGLVAATALGGLAVNFETLLGARVLAGVFGGPATSLALAIVSDVIPVERRGRALATVMTAFSVASIFGVPIALEVAHVFDWRAPFFAVSAMGLLTSAGALWLLPPMKLHFRAAGMPRASAREIFFRPLPLLAFAAMTCMMISAFLLIPSIPPYVVFNLGYQGEAWLTDWVAGLGMDYQFSTLGPLYMIGGLASLALMQVCGRLTDRIGATAMSWAGAFLMAFVVYAGFVNYQPWLSVMGFFVGFMGSGSLRGVPSRTLDSRIPRPQERAGFMSAQSAVQHISLALAAVSSSFILYELPDKSLAGVELAGWLSIAFALAMPLFITLIERRLRRRDAALLAQGQVAGAGAAVNVALASPRS
ncbi:MFS transporter [bacterium]|nr:MAG: MFS transporter [bacterium]RIK64093.1 MAG: MFS transporter [Planctomycetota bacterium]